MWLCNEGGLLVKALLGHLSGFYWNCRFWGLLSEQDFVGLTSYSILNARYALFNCRYTPTYYAECWLVFYIL